jgi:hypothetical protein
MGYLSPAREIVTDDGTAPDLPLPPARPIRPDIAEECQL